MNADALALKTQPRKVLGKKTRFLRRQGIIPVHLFGRGLDSLPLQCDSVELNRLVSRAGTTRLISLSLDSDKAPRSVFIKELQRDPLTQDVIHVDFYEVKKGEKITVEVPIRLTGEAPAVKALGGVLFYGIPALSIECLPENVPPQIEVDLSPLIDLDQTIYVKDIPMGPDITVRTELDQMVAKVGRAAVEKVEVAPTPVEAEAGAEAVAEGAAEGEATAEKAAPEEKPDKKS